MRPFRSSRLLAASVIAAGALGLSGAPAVDPIPVKAPVPAAAAPAKPAGPADEKEVRVLLKEKPKLGDGEAFAVKGLLEFLAKEHNLTVRIDLAAFKRFRTFDGAAGAASAPQAERVFIAFQIDQIGDIQEIYDVKIRLNTNADYTLADLLTDLCAQLPGKCAYRIRHNQVLIGPAFQPPVTPGAGGQGGEVQLAVSPHVLAEQLLGESVSVAINDKPLTDAVAELRKITGANIVLDARAKDKAKSVVSGTFDDARLLTVLELLADMCELKVVSNNNVFYITGPENAAKMQKQVHRDLFGEPFPQQGQATFPGSGTGLGMIPVPAPAPMPEPKK